MASQPWNGSVRGVPIPLRTSAFWSVYRLVDRTPVMQQPPDAVRAKSELRKRLMRLPGAWVVTGRPDRSVTISDTRLRLDDGTAEPRLKDADWHDVRVVRDGDKGTIDVYFDRDKTPILHAQDKALKKGRVGFGSFDDTGAFTDIVVEGVAAD